MRMKKVIGFLAIGLTAIACQAPQEDNTIQATFDANCETVRSALDNFQNEVATFDEYSADFVGSQTNFNPTGDSTSLDELKESRAFWSRTVSRYPRPLTWFRSRRDAGGIVLFLDYTGT